MEEVKVEPSFADLFNHWLASRDPEFSQRVAVVEADPTEKFTEEEIAKFIAYNTEYTDKRKQKTKNAQYPVHQQPFKTWLRENYLNINALSSDTIGALSKQFHNEKIVYDETYEAIEIDGKTHYFPSDYFTTFKEETAFVVELSDVKASPNPEVMTWRANEGNCVPPSLDVNNPFMDFVRDKDRSMNIMVETEQNGVRVFKMIHRVAGDNGSAGNYGDNQQVISDSEPESQSREDAPFIEVLEESKPEEERNFEELNRFYKETHLESYGITFQVFQRAMKAYYQALMYRLPGVISRVLPQDFTLYGQERANAAVVFHLNGDVFLDVYKPNYELQCTKLSTREGYLRAPFSTAVIMRMPFDKEEGVFTHPLIICDKEFAALLPIASLQITPPRVVLPKGKTVLDVLQEWQKQTELSQQMRDVIRELIDKHGPGKIPRKPMQGKNRGKIIGGAAAASFLIVLAVGVGLIPGGQLPALLVSLGVSADVVTSLVAAGAALAGSAAASGLTASLTTFFYWLVRKTKPREFKKIELKSIVPHLQTHAPGLSQILPFMTWVNSMDEELFTEDHEESQSSTVKVGDGEEFEFVLLGDNGAEKKVQKEAHARREEVQVRPAVQHQRRNSSPAFFNYVDKLDKGKGEERVDNPLENQESNVGGHSRRFSWSSSQTK